MFILFHLLTGLLIGYLLADRLGTRAVVLPCMFGALLSDLVDKPVGILLLGGALGGGRIFTHTLVFLALLLLVGLAVYRRYDRPALLAVGLGVASHQALDTMWTQPKAWLFPLLGPARPMDTEGWFLRELLQELTDPLEWVSAAALLVLLLPVLWPDGTAAFAARHARTIRTAALAATVPLAAVGLVLVASGALRPAVAAIGWKDPWTAIVAGAVLLLAAWAAYRLQARLAPGPGRPGFEPAPVAGPRD